MKILVLGGCGAMGTAASRDLAQTSDFAEIAIADVDLGRAQALAQELGGGRVRALRVDVADGEGLPRVLAEYDVVLNCTSYVFGLTITEAAIAARRPLLDLGGCTIRPSSSPWTSAPAPPG